MKRIKKLISDWRLVHEQLLKHGIDCGILKNCADQLESAITPQWISVDSPQKPEKWVPLWVAIKGSSKTHMAYWSHDRFWILFDFVIEVTHWTPIEFPNPPAGILTLKPSEVQP